jgi:hypothetical protein
VVVLGVPFIFLRYSSFEGKEDFDLGIFSPPNNHKKISSSQRISPVLPCI